MGTKATLVPKNVAFATYNPKSNLKQLAIMKQIRWAIKQTLKMTVQHILLPLVYAFWQAVFRKRVPGLIVFADAHHDTLPFSMQVMHEAVRQCRYTSIDFFHDYGRLSAIQALWVSVKFMKLYAQARYVFICDNFLPVASCRKNKRTKVIQLWHSCGLLKKMGYDTAEDVPRFYLGNVYKNYDLVTVSAPCCIGPLTSGMHLRPGIVQATGVSRTDIYFDKQWCDDCRAEFYQMYPEAAEKTVILWAPTFRGNAADPYQAGTEEIKILEKQLGSQYMVICKVHPYIDRKSHLSDCPIPTERLLPVTDLMITDYSSVVFDYLIFKKTFVLFAPDLKEYQEKRGFYVEYASLSPYVAVNGEELERTVHDALGSGEREWIEACRAFHLSACDGKATERIMKRLGLQKETICLNDSLMI